MLKSGALGTKPEHQFQKNHSGPALSFADKGLVNTVTGAANAN